MNHAWASVHSALGENMDYIDRGAKILTIVCAAKALLIVRVR